MSAELLTIPVRELKEHPDNPRKHFDEFSLSDLAASIREHGVLTPLLVRPNGEGFEIIGGHRRFRAAQVAQVEEVPAIVRHLDDQTALELMVLDNLQRDDLHPLEEAEGYAALMKHAGYDVQRIADRISKSAKYVYDRVKLLQLTPPAREIFLDGEISAGHAILLARLSSEDQQRAIGGEARYGQVGGLFDFDRGKDAPGLELGDQRRRKAVSVRELETWINDNVRFRPGEVDLPNLFPETAAALDTAQEEELKVVKITHDYRVPDGARDEKERTYGRPSWKRADGEIDGDGIWAKRKKSKPCEHAVLGVVVGGPGRGEAFRVCVAKKKCKVHWAQEMKEAEQRANGTGPSEAAARVNREEQHRKWEEERRKEEQERARWKKAAPQLLRALVEKLQATPALDLVDLVLGELRPHGFSPDTYMQRGATVEEAVRFGAFLVLSASVTSDWRAPTEAPKALKPFGIDAKKIVDEVAPKPKKPKKAPAEAEGEEEKAPGARARRRAKRGAESGVRTCRVCGCTDADCSGCVERTGDDCSWVEEDLCSACVPEEAPAEKAKAPGARARRRMKKQSADVVNAPL